MKQVFDLRNRLAHFKDKDVEIAKGTDVHEVVKVLKNIPGSRFDQTLKTSQTSDLRNLNRGRRRLVERG